MSPGLIMLKGTRTPVYPLEKPRLLRNEKKKYTYSFNSSLCSKC